MLLCVDSEHRLNFSKYLNCGYNSVGNIPHLRPVLAKASFYSNLLSWLHSISSFMEQKKDISLSVELRNMDTWQHIQVQYIKGNAAVKADWMLPLLVARICLGYFSSSLKWKRAKKPKKTILDNFRLGNSKSSLFFFSSFDCMKIKTQ